MPLAERETLQRVRVAEFEWWVRAGTSDLTSIREVAEKRAYFAGDCQPEPGEHWLDGGANIGAFTVVVAAAGARVTAYEPWPPSAELARRNLRENGLTGRVLEKALALEAGTARLGLARTEYAEWRHSLLRQGGDGHMTPVVAFADAVAGVDAVKLDVEGAEIALLTAPGLEQALAGVGKLCFEWHFDYAPATDLYLGVLERLRGVFAHVRARSVPAGTDYRWFPPAAIVRCWR